MLIASISSAGFAYMLAVINAPGVPGLDSEAIIPKSSEADAVYSQGLDELKRDGLLVPGARPNTWTLNDDLLTAVMVMASAGYVTRALLRDGNEMRAVLGYIAGGGVVEWVPLVNDRYQISLVPDQAVLIQRASALLMTDPQDVPDPDSLPQNERTGEFVIACVQDGELAHARTAYANGKVLQVETGPEDTDLVTLPLTSDVLAEMMTSFISENENSVRP